jgi:16S rRNA (cytosine967-C5)-methyltransferase
VTPARLAAARVLLAIDRGRTTLAAELERQRASVEDNRDRGLLLELTAGTLRWRNELDAWLAACMTRPLAHIDSAVLTLLRLGAYQLVHLDRIPPHAVVHESVELARALGHARATGFVNAVLRRLASRRPPKALPRRPKDTDSRASQVAYLATTLSHPAWLAERWLDRHGFAATEAWCRFNNETPAVTLAPTGRAPMADLAAALEAAGISAERARWVIDAFRLPPGSAGRLPEELSGALVIQDEGSQVVGHVVRAQPGERILDACAAPGGKTVVIARDMGRQGTLVATDQRTTRLRVLKGVLERAGVDAAVLQLDASRPLPFRDVFDAVLLDAPCSGLGTLRRDPDLKWSRQPEQLPQLAAAQRAMLAQAALAVRPGGRLIYATCSSEPEENEAVARAFLDAHPDFAEARIDPGPAVASGAELVDEHGHLRTLPFRDGLDAFFAALLVRRRAA